MYISTAMLSFQSFEKLSKCELYQIYVDLFKKVEEKDDLIKNYVIQCSTYIKERRQDCDQATYKKDQEVPHNSHIKQYYSKRSIQSQIQPFV